jgi:hypothetical protein
MSFATKDIKKLKNLPARPARGTAGEAHGRAISRRMLAGGQKIWDRSRTEKIKVTIC